MKMRHGFVSNSSSSSFTLITTEEEHQKIVDAMTEEHQKFVPHLVGYATLGKQKIVVFQDNSGEMFDYDGCGDRFLVDGVDSVPQKLPYKKRKLGEEDYDEAGCPVSVVDADDENEILSECYQDAKSAYSNLATKLKIKGLTISLDM